MPLEETLNRGGSKYKPSVANTQQAVQPNTVDQLPQKSINLDVADLSTMIDIVANSQAVEAFDQEMATKNSGAFGKMTGFFKRSFQRMGRDAWIHSKKTALKQKITSDLQNGICNEASIKNNYQEAKRALEEKAYLAHEQTQNETDISPQIQKLLDDWVVATPQERKNILPQLKQELDEEYKITSEMSQIEHAMIKFEQAQLDGTLKTLNAKLNVFDIGRYECGDGKRTESLLVKILDGYNGYISRTTAPDWMKQKVGGVFQHPNTYAILSALLTRAGVSAFVGGVSLGVGGLLIPVATGAVVGGVLAAGRARREMRDRTAQIDRRGATGFVTGDPSVDGASSNESHKTANYQHSVADFYAKVSIATHCDPLSASYNVLKADALQAGLNYLINHRVGRENNLNLLAYSGETSVSKQHVDMIVLLNKLFPGLVTDFNSGVLFQTGNTDPRAVEAQRLYQIIDNFSHDVLDDRLMDEKAYARKQGLIYAGVAVTIGSAGGYALHELGFGGSSGGHTIEHPTSSTVVSHYPDNLEPYTNVKRDFWYDNGTPKPKFDHTELMIHQKGENWNVHSMLGKTPWTQGHHIYGIQGSDFSSQKLQAVLTPHNGGPSFVLPIDAKGNIQIPEALQADFDARRFAFLEVGQVHVTGGTIHLTPIATVEGQDTMVLQPITTEIPGVPKQEFIPGTDNWYGVPFGGNRYHELKKPQSQNQDEELSLEIEEDTKSPKQDIPKERDIIADKMMDILTPKVAAKNDDFYGQEPEEVEAKQTNEQELGGANLNENFPIQQEIESDQGEPVDQNVSVKAGNNTSKTQEQKNSQEDSSPWELDEYGNEKMEPTDVSRAYDELQHTKEKIDKLNTLKARASKNQKTPKKHLDKKIEVLQKQMEKQTKVHNGKVKKLYERETPEQQQAYQDSISDLVEKGVIATDENGKILTFHYEGRSIIAIRAPNGQLIPFYRSCYGTDGKTKGKWFPFFGLSQNGWLVKGGIDSMEDAYHSPVLKQLSDTINGAFTWEHEWDTDFNSTQTFHPFTIYGSINSQEWIDQEMSNQLALQSRNGEMKFSNYWISEWITRIQAPKNFKLQVSSDGLYPKFLNLLESNKDVKDGEIIGEERQELLTKMFRFMFLYYSEGNESMILKKIVHEKIPVRIGDFSKTSVSKQGIDFHISQGDIDKNNYEFLARGLSDAISEYAIQEYCTLNQENTQKFLELQKKFSDPSQVLSILTESLGGALCGNIISETMQRKGCPSELVQECVDFLNEVYDTTMSKYASAWYV